MVEAYADESGTHADADLLCVTACVADPGQWRKFTRQWTRTLEEMGLTLFYMKDFKRRAGREYIPRFMGIIRRHVRFSVSVSISEKEYWEHASQQFRSKFGDAYALCAQGIFLTIAHRAKKEGIGPVAYFFESGPRGQQRLGEAFKTVATAVTLKEEFVFDRYAFLPKQGATPLQAADLIAYLVATSRQRPEWEEDRRLRKMGHLHIHLGPQEIKDITSDTESYMAHARRLEKQAKREREGKENLKVGKTSEKIRT